MFFDQNGKETTEANGVRHVYGTDYTVEDVRATPSDPWILWHEYLLLSPSESASIHLKWEMYQGQRGDYYRQVAESNSY